MASNAHWNVQNCWQLFDRWSRWKLQVCSLSS